MRTKTEKCKIGFVILIQNFALNNFHDFTISFIFQVSDRSCLNKMNEKNLALVFGPNLARPKEITADASMMTSVSAINVFTESLLVHQQELFH